MIEIKTEDLTEATLDGGGVFDELMRATKAHLQEEYTRGRIKGPEYSQVYLGAMQSVLSQAIQFTLEKDRSAAQADLLREQAATEIKNRELVDNQIKKTVAEIKIANEQLKLTKAQVAMTQQQTLNVEVERTTLIQQQQRYKEETLNITKQRDQIAAQIEVTRQQELNLEAERDALHIQPQVLNQQISNLQQENMLTEATRERVCQERRNLSADYERLVMLPELTTWQIENTKSENKVLEGNASKLAQEICKLAAEYRLLEQKLLTERAQVYEAGVDQDSVIGRQKGSLAAQTALYGAQRDGFVRDAEQKATKIMVDSWNVRRTTDEGTSANTTNKLDDGSVGRAVNQLLSGIGA